MSEHSEALRGIMTQTPIIHIEIHTEQNARQAVEEEKEDTQQKIKMNARQTPKNAANFSLQRRRFSFFSFL